MRQPQLIFAARNFFSPQDLVSVVESEFASSAIAKKGLGGKTPSLAEIEMVSVRSSFPSMNILPRGCHYRTLCSIHQRSTSNSTPCSVHGSAHTRRRGLPPCPPLNQCLLRCALSQTVPLTPRNIASALTLSSENASWQSSRDCMQFTVLTPYPIPVKPG